MSRSHRLGALVAIAIGWALGCSSEDVRAVSSEASASSSTSATSTSGSGGGGVSGSVGGFGGAGGSVTSATVGAGGGSDIDAAGGGAGGDSADAQVETGVAEAGGGADAFEASVPPDAGHESGTPPVSGKRVLYVYEEANDQVDPAFEGVLKSKGLMVDAVLAPAATAAMAANAALVVISPGCTRADVGMKFTDVPVPVIVSKDAPPTYMKLTTSDASTENNATQIAITAPDDPLAAGLKGTVTVYSGVNRVLYGSPAPSAKRIATVVGSPDQVAIYAYEAGDAMVGGFKAPAKRMGFFVHRVANVTPSGLKLFAAAVDWALGP